jgi:hypothetical protein
MIGKPFATIGAATCPSILLHKCYTRLAIGLAMAILPKK